jgi:hypothetical protein
MQALVSLLSIPVEEKAMVVVLLLLPQLLTTSDL